MTHINFPFEIKAVEDTGAFSGHASVWNILDRQNDIVRPNAFREIVKNSDGRVVFLWQHDSRSPIGTAQVHEDARGLAFDGKLILEDPKARIAQAHMRAKSVSGVSIGYDILPDGSKFINGVRELTGLRLWELSLVTFPALPEAQVETVKGLSDCADAHEIKNYLRECHQFSRTKAALASDALWKIMSSAKSDSDDEEISPGLQHEINRILNFTQKA